MSGSLLMEEPGVGSGGGGWGPGAASLCRAVRKRRGRLFSLAVLLKQRKLEIDFKKKMCKVDTKKKMSGYLHLFGLETFFLSIEAIKNL